MRRQAKVISIGKTKIGGNEKIAVQSMLNIPPNDIERNIEEAKKLKSAGCDILRISIPNKDSIRLIEAIKTNVDIPLVADIHYDYKLAIESASAGIDKIRINPGNIGDQTKIKAVVNACREHNIPIRIGVNGGSLEKEILNKYKTPCAEALCESAFYHVSLLERFDFDNIVLSLKSSNVKTMIKAYEMIASKCKYPLHLGVTEAGTEQMGIVKSSIGIGALLAQGIGDTIRVSLTADPIKEITAGYNILKALNLSDSGVEVISCPTCGRTRIDIIKIANEIEDRLKKCNKKIKIAIMGCAVNGPGEASEADIGVAGGKGEGLIFKKGKITKKVNENNIIDALIEEIEKM